MRTQLHRFALLLACIVALGCLAVADSFTFSVIPAGGAISGSPGQTIGWDYSITNHSTSWLETISLNPAGFQPNWNPVAIFDFPVVAPGATVTVDFNPGTSPSAATGLFELRLPTTVTPGTFTCSCQVFGLNADWFLTNPLTDANPVETGHALQTTPTP